jgi:Zn-dependent protease with chaperone function
MTGALIFGLVFIFTKRPNHMFLSQMVSSVAIVEGFRQMNCAMSGYVWGYFGIISGAMVFLGVIQMVFDRHVGSLEISDARLMGKLSDDIGCQVFLLDTQKIKAFTHKRRIYLSVGLVELLEYPELMAIATHELYHVNHTPNRILANSLAVASLWLRSYRDDAKADEFAAEKAGLENLKSAFKKLGVRGARRRIARLAS